MTIRHYELPRLAAAFRSTALASSEVLGDSVPANETAFWATLPNNVPVLNQVGHVQLRDISQRRERSALSNPARDRP